MARRRSDLHRSSRHRQRITQWRSQQTLRSQQTGQSQCQRVRMWPRPLRSPTGRNEQSLQRYSALRPCTYESDSLSLDLGLLVCSSIVIDRALGRDQGALGAVATGLLSALAGVM